jgi:TPP-dependent pyruvate/acetoin dehydrogenase alpha subunit
MKTGKELTIIEIRNSRYLPWSFPDENKKYKKT